MQVYPYTPFEKWQSGKTDNMQNVGDFLTYKKGGDPMYDINTIISAGKSGDFEPRDYLNTAEADKAIMALEKVGKAQTVDDIITFFQGFARGLEEAKKGLQG